MDIQNRSSINFKANVSQSVMYQLQKQVKNCHSRKKCSALVKQKVENLKSWGSPDSNIVIAKDHNGKYLLGVECTVDKGLRLPWAIRNLVAKTELELDISNGLIAAGQKVIAVSDDADVIVFE